MADKKITALTALTGANTASTDVFPIVDVSATETKKITAAELAAAIAAIGLNAGESVPTKIHGIELPATHMIRFEGTTDNDFETFLTVVDPTADRTLTFPNETGTVATQAYVTTAVAAVSADFSNDQNILNNAVFS